jgi:predicted phage baseplate assembly protein
MPLPKPSLDNRRYEQLVAEGLAQLPRLAPGWTDHNASDPGITLLELGAWMSEQAIYRFDRLSAQALRGFVRLAGVEPRAAGVAHCVVGIGNPGAGIHLPPRIRLAGTAGPDTPHQARFETVDALWASPAQLVQLRAGAAPGRDITTQHTASLADASFGGIPAFGSRPRAGHALWLGFDRALDAPGQTLSLYLFGADPAADDATRTSLRAEHADALRRGHALAPWQSHYRVRSVWEFHAGGGVWLPLTNLSDDTRALSLSGFVRCDAPAGHHSGGAPGLSPGLFYLRCRIQRGRYECPPMLRGLCFNAVACEHALSQAKHPVGHARGHAGAVFTSGDAPIVADSVTLRLDDGAGSVQDDWHSVTDWDRSGPHDRSLRLDATLGQWHSGDGLHGQITPAGYTLLASYRIGGGLAGNLPRASLDTLAPDAHNLALAPALAAPAPALHVHQPVPARGGAPAETLAQAQARAYDNAVAVDKAVTLGDIERLALATPGVPLARARAIASYDRRWPNIDAAGVVSVVLIPRGPRPAPMPSLALLRAVERYLAPRRLITSELHAIAPRYRRVGVSATLHLACGDDAGAVLRAARACIAGLFDPIDGGPSRQGWPFGRSVYRNDVLAALARLPGVDHVSDLGLLAGATGCGACGDAGADGGASCDNVALCPHELPRPGRHRFSIATEFARTLTRSLAHECPTD